MNPSPDPHDTSNLRPPANHKVRHKEHQIYQPITTTMEIPTLLQRMQTPLQEEIIPPMSLLTRISSPLSLSNPLKILLNPSEKEKSTSPKPLQNLSPPCHLETILSMILLKNQHSPNISHRSTLSPDLNHILPNMDTLLMQDLDQNGNKLLIMMKSSRSSLISHPHQKEEIQSKRRRVIERQKNLTGKQEYQIKNDIYMKKICPGLNESQLQGNQQILAVKKPAKSSKLLDWISPMSNAQSNLHNYHLQDSDPQNGITSYKELLSASTMSTHLSTTSHLLKRMLDVWDQLKLAWDLLNLQDECEPRVTGSQLITRLSK